MAQRGAIMDDYTASIWLKTALCTLEGRDPVDAFNDTEILRKLAFVRMETAFNNPQFAQKLGKQPSAV